MAGMAGSILVEFISPAIRELAPFHLTYTQGPLVTLALKVPRKGMDRYQVKGRGLSALTRAARFQASTQVRKGQECPPKACLPWFLLRRENCPYNWTLLGRARRSSWIRS